MAIKKGSRKTAIIIGILASLLCISLITQFLGYTGLAVFSIPEKNVSQEQESSSELDELASQQEQEQQPSSFSQEGFSIPENFQASGFSAQQASAPDPGHSASSIGPGVFRSGTYVFPNESLVRIGEKEQLWFIKDHGLNSSYPKDIDLDGDALYIAGYLSFNFGWEGKWVIEKRNISTGDLIWRNITNITSAVDKAEAITFDDGFVYVVGGVNYGAMFPPPPTSIRIEKRNATTGQLIWYNYSNPGYYAWAYDIATDADSIYLVGVSDSKWLIEKRDKTDGSLIWRNISTFNGTANRVAVDSTGVYIGGTAQPYDQWRVEKRNLTNGELIWKKGWSCRPLGIFAGMEVSSHALYLIIQCDYQSWTLEKLNLTTGNLTTGVYINIKTQEDERVMDLKTDLNNFYILIKDPNYGDRRWTIEKRSLYDGSLVWAQESNPGPYSDFPYAFDIDNKAAYIVGFSNNGSADIWVVEKRTLNPTLSITAVNRQVLLLNSNLRGATTIGDISSCKTTNASIAIGWGSHAKEDNSIVIGTGNKKCEASNRGELLLCSDYLNFANGFSIDGVPQRGRWNSRIPLNNVINKVFYAWSINSIDLTIGKDGLPVYVYNLPGLNDLEFIKCQDVQCKNDLRRILEVWLSSNSRGISITLDKDANPVIAYQDYPWLFALYCLDPRCNDYRWNFIDYEGGFPSVALGIDGDLVFSYYNQTGGDLKFAKCSDSGCQNRTIDSSGDVGLWTSIAIAGDGMPVIAYLDKTNSRLRLAKCEDINCTSTSINSYVDNSTDSISMTIGNDGFPIIAHRWSYGTLSYLRVVKCQDFTCSNKTTEYPDYGSGTEKTGFGASITLGLDGLPIISYIDNGALKVLKCSDYQCSSGVGYMIYNETIINSTSIAIGSDGLPVIGFFDNTSWTYIAHCGSDRCLPYWTRR